VQLPVDLADSPAPWHRSILKQVTPCSSTYQARLLGARASHAKSAVHRLSRRERIKALNHSFSEILHIRTTNPFVSTTASLYRIASCNIQHSFANSPIMSAMLAMSFDELQADVIPREVFDQYRCIWNTGNDRCESVLTDQNSLATLRSILTSPKSQLDDKTIQHAGHLSLCPDHGDVICLGDVFNTYWMHDIASDVDFSGPQTPFQHNPGSAGNDASPGDIPARQSQTLPSPPTGSPNPSRPHGIVTVSESAVPRLAGPPSPTVTHLPRHARPSRASSAFTTPTRDSRRVVSTPVSQPSGRKSSITSPSCLASASGRRNTYNYPLFSTLQAEFRNNDLKQYRCLAKRGSGRCKNMIDNDETLDQVRRITAEPITRLTPDDVREVNRLLTCAEGGQYEKQQREIESTWKDEFPGFPSDFGALLFPGSLPCRRKSPSQAPPASDAQFRGKVRRQTHVDMGESADSDSRDAPGPEDGAPDSVYIRPWTTEALIQDSKALNEFNDPPPCSCRDRSEDSRSLAPEGDVMIGSRSGNEDTPDTSPSHECRYKADGFTEGVSTTWSPTRVRQEVAELFNTPLPTQKTVGTLYLLKAEHSSHVKIGYTLGNWKERKSDIETKSGIILDANNTQAIQNIPYAVLLRLEQIVHTDLAPFQRHVPLKKKTRAQHEWFEIDFHIAKKTAEFWLDKISTPGTRLGDVDQVTDAEKEQTNWPGIHRDHERRFRVWDMVANTPPKPSWWNGLQSAWRKFGMLWVLGWIVIFLAGIAERSSAMVVSVLLMALWSGSVLWILENGCPLEHV